MEDNLQEQVHTLANEYRQEGAGRSDGRISVDVYCLCGAKLDNQETIADVEAAVDANAVAGSQASNHWVKLFFEDLLGSFASGSNEGPRTHYYDLQYELTMREAAKEEHKNKADEEAKNANAKDTMKPPGGKAVVPAGLQK